jgi:hypothetical protein
MVKQRNARLADALGIKGAAVSDAPVTASASGMGEVDWAPELKDFAKANLAWVKVVEGTLGGFVKGGKQSMVLPHSKFSYRHR